MKYNAKLKQCMSSGDGEQILVSILKQPHVVCSYVVKDLTAYLMN